MGWIRILRSLGGLARFRRGRGGWGQRFFSWLVGGLGLLLLTAGCTPASWLAQRMRQAPNTFPRVLGPEPAVSYAFPGAWLTNFPLEHVSVGPPSARLAFRIVEPAAYGFHLRSTHWLDGGRPRYRFDFEATVPGPTNRFSARPPGTLFLLHGYGVDSTCMFQWALALADDGWRCVLVDLRGHGSSTGRQVSFGAVESHDLRQLADFLERDGRMQAPGAVLGASYGAALALKWAGEDTRLEKVVALTPYAELQPSVLAIRDHYARWLPRTWVRAAAERLPARVGVGPDGLDPLRWLTERPVRGLFIATVQDPVAPPAAVRRLHAVARPGSDYWQLPEGLHETAPFQFDELLAPVRAWLKAPEPGAGSVSPGLAPQAVTSGRPPEP